MSFWAWVGAFVITIAGFYIGILLDLYWQGGFVVLFFILAYLAEQGTDYIGSMIISFLLAFVGIFLLIGMLIGNGYYYHTMYDPEVVKEVEKVDNNVTEKSFNLLDWLNSKPFEGKE